ncbi:MAG: BMP family ABC transporter substrate-binding protein, partial [Candidatus Limnocylindrales bacterium]
MSDAPASAGPLSSDSGPSVGPGASPSTPICSRRLRVGLVGQPGSLTDPGSNASAVAGLEAAAAAAPSCFEMDSVASKTVDDAASDLAAYASDGRDIVIGVGQALGDALGDAAVANPGTRFIGVDAAPGPTHDSSWSTNGESLFFAEDQQGYLAGVLAALVSPGHNVGVVGGLLMVPQVESSVEGFMHGASATVPGITVQFAYSTSFDDPAQGGATTQAMVAKGADVIFSTGGATGDGALLAACKAGILAIGSDTDQALSLPAAAP